MLESARIQKRQSELRQELAELSRLEALTDEQRSRIDAADREYSDNERRYRAALIAEDSERREAGAELETRGDREWRNLEAAFELRQVALHLAEGRGFDGATGEVVEEMRSAGGYRGIPVPLAALLETRAGETVSTGTPSPRVTAPIIDQLFANTAISRMGGATVNVAMGEREYPITTQGATVGWATSETGSVASPQEFQTEERVLTPEHTLGAQMRITRRALKQSGAGLEAAIRRDMANALRTEVDRAAFQGSGASGQPLGVMQHPDSPTTIVSTEIASGDELYIAIAKEVTEFLKANAAASPSDVRLLLRPEVWRDLQDDYISGTSVSGWMRLGQVMSGREPSGMITPNIAFTTNAIPAPSGSPLETSALLTVTAGGVAPFWVATWGALDVIRDPYSDAASGGLRLTGLLTVDVQPSRYEQIRVLTGIGVA